MGEVVQIFYKRGGAIRDIRLIGAHHPANPTVPPGYVCVDTDISMQGHGFIDGDDCTRIAYTTGGTATPITGFRVVSSDAMRVLLQESEGASQQIAADADLQDNASLGIAHVTLGTAFGWSCIGTLPGDRHVMVQRGHGSPIASLNVFRSPVAVPRYGFAGIVDMLPNNALEACIGVPRRDPTAQARADATTVGCALDNAYWNILTKWRSVDGAVNSMTFRPAMSQGHGAADGGDEGHAPVRVIGYHVYGMLGLLDSDTESESDDADGKAADAGKRAKAQIVLRTGALDGLIYRRADEHEATGDCSGHWILAGEWSGKDDDDKLPIQVRVTIPRDPAVAPTFTGKRVTVAVSVRVEGVCASGCLCYVQASCGVIEFAAVRVLNGVTPRLGCCLRRLCMMTVALFGTCPGSGGLAV